MAEDMPTTTPTTAPTPSNLWETLFSTHPRSLGETYWQHLAHALEFALSMLAGGAACLIHALIPALFVQTASNTILRLHARLAATGRLDRRRPTSP